eukprot:CAMPEP_0176491992 /NCGR_PEP_ID=MMETSP0200_2-20121128/8733_1 /TAXON_ID=947934 /ORGANISM="Chaetoceros sp., Strain GSL56" /LENGTH=297 /DNA_ID=CAMNT_0017889469 /DNA_START=97 /DNA_END=990 /DNA_ORIENTATION=-
MQGRGVSNYSTEKPSHSFSTNTTQFDDELLARKIITFEQAMMAKGASSAEARRLALLKIEQDNKSQQEKIQYNLQDETAKANKDFGEDGEDDENITNENDEAEISQYRTKRLVQLQCGNVIPISRTEWTREVNESSHSQWVVILLTCTSSAPNLNPYHREICQKVEQDIIPYLAGKFNEVKWVSIPSKGAIENWPDDNLPTLFCYRRGKLQCQLVGLDDFGENITPDSIEYIQYYQEWVESDIEEIDLQQDKRNGPVRFGKYTSSKVVGYGRSQFQGGMATFATRNDADLCDYDDVD